jgi:hypothetical protein
MISREQQFQIVVRAGNGTAVDTSHYKPDSFEAAVAIGNALQCRNGCTVMVIDKSEHPHRRYSISGNGTPTLLPRQ